jgi:hypothetical protein
MKRNQLLVLSVLALGLQGVAQASPYPSDAEASYNLPASGSYSGGNWTGPQVGFPSDAEASYNVAVRETHADRHAADAVSARVAQMQASISFRGNIDD